MTVQTAKTDPTSRPLESGDSPFIGGLSQGAAAVVQVLRQLLEQAESLAGHAGRSTALTARLKLDKSLASKAIRAAQTEDPLAALLVLPGAQGLSMIARSARRAGVAATLCDALVERARELDAIIAALPDGKADLEATLAGWFPQEMSRGERRARLAAHRSAVFLAGTSLEAAYECEIHMPGQNDGWCDSITLAMRLGFRRLRLGSRHIVSGLPSVANDYPGLTMSTLDGEPYDDGPLKAVVREFSSDPLPNFDVMPRGRGWMFAIGSASPDLGEPVDVATALRVRGICPRYATDELEYEHFTMALRKPTRALVMDLLIHKSMFVTGEPELTTRLYGEAPPPPRIAHSPDGKPLFSEYDPIASSAELRRLGPGMEALASPLVPRVRDFVGFGLQKLDTTIHEFRAYRISIEYPLPGMQYRVWMPLDRR